MSMHSLSRAAVALLLAVRSSSGIDNSSTNLTDDERRRRHLQSFTSSFVGDMKHFTMVQGEAVCPVESKRAFAGEFSKKAPVCDSTHSILVPDGFTLDESRQKRKRRVRESTSPSKGTKVKSKLRGSEQTQLSTETIPEAGANYGTSFSNGASGFQAAPGISEDYPYVTAYDDPQACSGTRSRSVSFKVNHPENNCDFCWDSCMEFFDNNDSAHTHVRSIDIPHGYIALMYTNCNGAFGSGDPELDFAGVLTSGCHEVPHAVVHFDFGLDQGNGRYIMMGRKGATGKSGTFDAEFSSNHWYYGPDGIDHAIGLSYYTHVYNFLDPSQPRMDFQTGIGGTWLHPSTKPWSRGDPCYCNPDSWPVINDDTPSCQEYDKTDCLNGCCGISGCQGLQQTLEGGTGYWMSRLPTSVPKWAVGATTACYNIWANGPMEVTNDPALQCNEMGIMALSNRFLLPPDGIPFQGEGMLGTGWFDTPVGKRSNGDNRHAWTLILDAKNFKGPVAYMLPEYWEHGRYPGRDGKMYPEENLGNVGLSTGGYAYEVMQIPVVGYDDGQRQQVKIPKFRMSLNGEEGDSTLLMTGYKSWTDRSDIYDQLATLLDGQGGLNEDELLKADRGLKHSCQGLGNSQKLTLSLKGKGWDMGGTIRNTEKHGECVSEIFWDFDSPSVDCSRGDQCRFKEAYEISNLKVTGDPRSGEISVSHGGLDPLDNVPRVLESRSFPTKSSAGRNPERYDHTKSDFCGGQQAEQNVMHCVQSRAGDWMGYKWFRFVDQPGLQRLRLNQQEKDYMQARIVRLHKAMAAKSPQNPWLKPPNKVPSLVEVDDAILVTPPSGMEVGYVPLVVYQGMDKPPGCAAPQPKQPISNNPTEVENRPKNTPENNVGEEECEDARFFTMRRRKRSCLMLKRRKRACEWRINKNKKVKDICRKMCNQCSVE